MLMVKDIVEIRLSLYIKAIVKENQVAYFLLFFSNLEKKRQRGRHKL